MRDFAFNNVREPLLRAGIAPTHVNRYVTELQDHRSDLIERYRAEGLGLLAAEQKAQETLGTDAQLVQAMLDSNPPRSLAAKAPWAVFGLFPIVAQMAASIALGATAMAYFSEYSNVAPANLSGATRAMAAGVTYLGSYFVGAVLMLVCVMIAARQRHFSGWMWVGLGSTALVFGVLGVHIDFVQATSGIPGGMRGSLAQLVHAPDGRLEVASSVLLITARALGLFLLSVIALRGLSGVPTWRKSDGKSV